MIGGPPLPTAAKYSTRPESFLSRILVTDAEQRSSLAVVRSLGRAGHEIYTASADPRPLAGASRYSRRTYRLPDPHVRPRDFQEAVRQAVQETDAHVLLPMTDISIPLVMGIREELPGVVIPYPSADDYFGISDKYGLTQVAAELGIPVPRQILLTTPRTPDPSELADLGFPLVIKPARSAIETSRGTERAIVRLASSEEDLLSQLEAFYPPEAYPLLLQERIVGPGMGAFLLSWDGAVVAAFAHRRIREKPPTGGVSVYRESIPLRPDLLDYASRLLSRFRWRGVAMIEFKEDAATGTPYLMEVNGRFWGSLQLAVDAGVRFPDILVALATGATVEPVRDYAVGVRSRWLWGDVDHLIGMLKNAGALRSVVPELPGRLGALGRFLVPWRPGDRFEVMRMDDPLPFLRESGNWLRSLRGPG